MDLQNIDFLSKLGHNVGNEDMEDTDEDEDQLDDELNAILSGKTYVPKNKQTTTSSAVNTKRVKQMDSKQTKSHNTSNTRHKSSQNTNQLIGGNGSNDLLNIDKLGIIEGFDDDSDIDENDEQFLSEINSIVSEDTSSAKNKSPNKSEYKTRQPIDSRIPEINTMQMQTPMNPQIVDKTPKTYPTNSGPKNETIVSVMSADIASNQSKQTDDKNTVLKLNTLKDEYKRAALVAKKAGQATTALSHIKTAKQIEVLISAIEEGKAVDLSHLPPPPTALPSPTPSTGTSTAAQTPKQLGSDETKANEETDLETAVNNVELTTEDAKKFFNAPPPPNTVMEALEQRLAKFKSTLSQANEENNGSKSRRLGRIVKQYENAIKDFKKGKVIDFEELPTPPGFGPIPPMNAPKPAVKAPEPTVAAAVKNTPKPANPTTGATNLPDKTRVQTSAANSSPSPPKAAQKPNLKRASSTANKQLNYLLERQRMFKEAALESKQKGDLQQAKEYLRMAKGFDPLIEATQNGLPIDATSIPTPPQIGDDFVIVSHPECSQTDDLEKEEIFRKIEVELQNQIEMCKRNKEYFLQLGDISTSSKFEKYAIDSRKDLDVLTARWRSGHKVPNFKYETRTFSIVICNTEVGVNEVTVEVVKAVDIPGKPDIDTYVRLDFPFPNEHNQTGRTKTVKNSLNPVFNETFKFEIDRKSRQLPRTLKRHPLKLELMSKGGLFRNDTLIGTALIKMTDFETKCTIHESFPLTEGRKAVGGRLEAKVRIREPLLAKQLEEVKEKWLVFL